ncbi:MAG TPA: hypothetical protein VMM92_03600, partial [Thermoanaerobaculia bacterium]|nr:hypothetical protein [Thermoanaerobaculia bacterium]
AKGLGIPAQLGGTGKPLPDSDVLDAAETAKIQDRINNFNAIIAQAASDAGAALVDVNALFRGIAAEGLDIGGIVYTNSFLTGGLFSLDGVHPTPFGYAYTANAFIDAINAKFSARIPEVDLYPFMFGPQASSGSLQAGDSLAAPAMTPEAIRNLQWVLVGDAKVDGSGGNGGNGNGGNGGTSAPPPARHHRNHGG